MKRMKTLLTVLVSFVMLLVFSNTAFATNTVTVTVPEELKDHDFVAYQIFTGTQAESGGSLGDVKWGNGIDSANFLKALQDDATIGSEFASCSVNNPAGVAEAISKLQSNSTQANIVAKLASESKSSTSTELKIGNNELTTGYYLIVDVTNVTDADNAANAALLQVTSNINITKKTDKPSVEKKVLENKKYSQDGGYGQSYNDVADYNIGDAVPFKLIGTVPDMTHYKSYSYTFHDELSKGLTLDENSIKIYVSNDKAGNDGKQEITGWTKKVSGQTFTINFKDLKTVENVFAGKFILVEYTATLNSNAEIGLPGNPNEVWLTYSNKPDQSGEGTPGEGKTPHDKVIVFTYELDTTKVDGATKDPKSGAEFKLANEAGKWAVVDENSKVTGWADTEDGGSVLTSGDDGKFKVIGLDDGNYSLKETKAPSGYNQLANPITFTISATTKNDQNWTTTPEDALTALTIKVGEAATENGNTSTGIVETTIENNKGTVLPATGGLGTTMFYMIGGLLMLATAILLITKRRMNTK